MNKFPTVFVVQDPDGKEIMLAKKYGTFSVILTGKESTEQAQFKLKRALLDFKPTDFLLPIGKSLNMGMAIHYAWEALRSNKFYACSNLNVLIWRREEYDYSVESITL